MKPIGLAVGFLVCMFLSQVAALYFVTVKPNNLSKFNLSEEQIAGTLEGRAVPVTLNQIWPFDSSQNLTTKINKKKSLDEFVILVVDVSAKANLPAEGPKEQYTNTPVKPKSPTKLQLIGSMKLTYELFDNTWYLIGADNLNLKMVSLE